MKQRILSLAFALAVLTGLSCIASAEEISFAPARTYREQFRDVSPDSWYYSSVKILYELGLTQGQGSGDTFAPDDPITLAEMSTIASRLRSLYLYGDCEQGPSKYTSGSWFSPYTAFLREQRILGSEFDGQYSRPATRAQAAHLLASALPSSFFSEINAEQVNVGYASRKYITDVSEYTPYQQDILKLYRWGILSGMDRSGAFLPDEEIQRSQAAVMVARITDESLRLRLDWDTSVDHSRAGTTMADLVTSSGAFHQAPDPKDELEIDQNIRYMLSRGENTMVLRYPENTLTEETVDQLTNAFLTGVRYYVEQEYNQVTCNYSHHSGLVTVTFSSSLYDPNLMHLYRDAIMEKAIEIHDSLWEDGTIDSTMSQYDKALAYFTWLCDHCTYDFKSKDDSLSHSSYGALLQQSAVCDGYTSAYNLLLKLEDIQCTTRSTDSHIWTVAFLDGNVCHIDLTWGDQTGTTAYRYFGMTETASMARFR